MDDIRIRREQYRTLVVWWWCRSWSMSLSAFFLMRRAGNELECICFAMGMGTGVHTERNRPSRAAPARARQGMREAGRGTYG